MKATLVRAEKVRRKVEGETRRPFFCSACGERVPMAALRCSSCGEYFAGGWRDDTGDRGRG